LFTITGAGAAVFWFGRYQKKKPANSATISKAMKAISGVQLVSPSSVV
jgi:hypothetical protein